jgi:ADP-ribose pyrophosphatase YjhB (NUDIX family)
MGTNVMEEIEEASLPQTHIAVIITDDKGDVLLGRAQEGFDKDKISMPLGPVLPFESLSDAAKRVVMEWAGISVEPQHAIFVCESINQKQEEHRIVVFVIANRPGPGKTFGESFWTNVRNLGEYQDEMSNIAADGFYKLSLVLKQQAAAVDKQTPQA